MEFRLPDVGEGIATAEITRDAKGERRLSRCAELFDN